MPTKYLFALFFVTLQACTLASSGTLEETTSPLNTGAGGHEGTGGTITASSSSESTDTTSSSTTSQECDTADDCPESTSCVTYSCNSNECNAVYADAGTVVTTNSTAGDCQALVCDGQGEMVSIADDSDSPDDQNECTLDTCINGVPDFPNVDNGTNCGEGLSCVDGSCSGCMDASQCPTGNECKTPVCESGTCSFDILSGSELPDNDDTDCFHQVCDSEGNISTTGDVDDVPVPDNNVCDLETCGTDGSVTHVPLWGDTCAEASGPCFEDSICSAGTCVEQPKEVGTLVADGSDGNCLQLQCDGNGNSLSVPDDSDVPTDNNSSDCYGYTCTAGIVVETPVSDGTTCGEDKVCCGGSCCEQKHKECCWGACCGPDNETTTESSE